MAAAPSHYLGWGELSGRSMSLEKPSSNTYATFKIWKYKCKWKRAFLNICLISLDKYQAMW